MHVAARRQCRGPAARPAHLRACIAPSRASTTQQPCAACLQVQAVIVRAWAAREGQMGHPERATGALAWRSGAGLEPIRPHFHTRANPSDRPHTIASPLQPPARRWPLVLPRPGPSAGMDLLGGYGSGSDSEPGSPSGAGAQGRVTLLTNSAPEPQAAPAARDNQADPAQLLTSLPAPSGSKVRAAATAALPPLPAARLAWVALCLVLLAQSRGISRAAQPIGSSAADTLFLPPPARCRCSRACPSRRPRSG